MNLLVALAAAWTLAAGAAEARCDLTDPAIAAAPPAPAAMETRADPARAPAPSQALAAPRREAARIAPAPPRTQNGGRNVTPPPRSAIPDGALMSKRRIL
ncbi:MAG: hypothetical protein JNJ73_20030 [Hyphomonadaceae bacterium]|nr:hypothetical protein [Hyphomonadaceae bacterium]